MRLLVLIVILLALTLRPSPAAEEKGDVGDAALIREAFIKSAAQQKVLRIGLLDCIAYALRKNNDIRIARIEPKLKSDDVRIAQSAFEPTLNAEYTLHDTTTESTNIFFPKDSKIRDINFNAALSGKLQTGAEYSLDFLNQRYRSNADISSINPYYSVEPILTVTQPLLRDFGITVNRADIIIAKNNWKQSEEAFRNTAMDVISQAKNAYYTYCYAIEAYAIAEIYLNLARDLMDINKARYGKGLVSSVDLLETEAAVAEREKLLITAENNLKASEDNLKYVTNLVDDPELWNARLELIDMPAFTVEKVDLVQSITDAFEYRPDYIAKKLDLKNRDITIIVKKNALFPTLDAVGSFGLNGLDNNYANALDKVNKHFPDWSVGGTLTIPWGMGDRAKYDQAKLEKARAILDLQRIEQKIILQVRDKVREVDIQFRTERAAREAKDKEEQNYDAQKERYSAGQVSTHDMIDYQEKVSRARLDHMKAIVDYNIALINLDKEVGLTLVKNNVRLEERDEESK
jgi:outer membrane protein TolC